MTETLEALAMVTSAHRAMGLANHVVTPWWISQILLDDRVVGDIGYHGPPASPATGDDPAVDVEIGYNVVPGLPGRGIATRAVGLLLDQAWRDGATVVRAETDADNIASRRVLLGAGFTTLGDDLYVITRPVDG